MNNKLSYEQNIFCHCRISRVSVRQIKAAGTVAVASCAILFKKFDVNNFDYTEGLHIQVGYGSCR